MMTIHFLNQKQTKITKKLKNLTKKSKVQKKLKDKEKETVVLIINNM